LTPHKHSKPRGIWDVSSGFRTGWRFEPGSCSATARGWRKLRSELRRANCGWKGAESLDPAQAFPTEGLLSPDWISFNAI
jgi:hypothetical protein